MGNRESFIGKIGKNERRDNGYKRKVKRTAEFMRNLLTNENKNKEKTKGPRIISIEKYKETGSYLEAKKELEKYGVNPEIYGDNVFKTWIKEDLPDKTIDEGDER